jgi:hypothetical protein
MDALDRRWVLAGGGGRGHGYAEFILLRFSEIDTDGDKRLSAKELEAATRNSPRVRVLYDALDVDHNNRVSPSELRNPSLGVGLLRIEF